MPGCLSHIFSIWLTGCLLFIALLALNGCAASLGTSRAPVTPVAANTQSSQTQNGIITVAQNAQPGIGGTGIIGTVTGFGSILVNGFEVEYAQNIPITFKDRTVQPDALRIGQVVEIEAEGRGKILRALRLSIRHEVAGPIERIDEKRRIAVIFGQRIEIPKGIIFQGNGLRKLKFSTLTVGDHIDVSGLRRANGVIAASRIDKTGPGGTAVLRGQVTASGQGSFSVNGMRVEALDGTRATRLYSGQEVQIIGTALQGVLRARRINALPFKPFLGRVRRLSVEGYVRRVISGGAVVGQIPITQLPARVRIQAGERVILDGSVSARGRFAPTRLRRPRVKQMQPGAPPAPRPPVSRAPYPQRLPVQRTQPRTQPRTQTR